MKRREKIIYGVCILSVLIVIHSIYSWYNPRVLVDNFELLESDYNTIVRVLEEYYNEQPKEEYIGVSISQDYTLSHNDKEIELSTEERNSLEKICKESYYGDYRLIRITEFDISFWEGETVKYGIIYTKSFAQTMKSNIKSLSDTCHIRRINKEWYEFGDHHI